MVCTESLGCNCRQCPENIHFHRGFCLQKNPVLRTIFRGHLFAWIREIQEHAISTFPSSLIPSAYSVTTTLLPAELTFQLSSCACKHKKYGSPSGIAPLKSRSYRQNLAEQWQKTISLVAACRRDILTVAMKKEPLSHGVLLEQWPVQYICIPFKVRPFGGATRAHQTEA